MGFESLDVVTDYLLFFMLLFLNYYSFILVLCDAAVRALAFKLLPLSSCQSAAYDGRD